MNTVRLDFPPNVKLWNLSSESAVYVVAETLESAIEHYHTLTGIPPKECICEPCEVPEKEWYGLTYEPEKGTGMCSFATFMAIVLERGALMPFLLATED